MSDATTTATGAPVPGGRPLPFLAKYGRFVLVGLTGVGVNLVVFAALLDLLSGRPTLDLYGSLLRSASTARPSAVANFVASAVAFVGATLWNFTWNNLWTFRPVVRHRHPFNRRLGLYFGISLGSLAVNEVVLFAASFVLAPLYGQAIGIALGSLVGFAGNHRVTFAEAALAP